MSKRYQLDGQVRDDMRLSTQVLQRGQDHTVSFAGTSQFTAQGVSACGLAAFNFARIAFRIEQNRKNLVDVLNELSTKDIIEVSVHSFAVPFSCRILSMTGSVPGNRGHLCGMV